MTRRRGTVVFLHGLFRKAGSLEKLRRAVEAEGYETWAETYPSRKQSIEELAGTVADRIRNELDTTRLYAVTHSLGGILLRHLRDVFDWQGVVMLAPPNQGSRVAERFSDISLFKWLFGPAGLEVARSSEWPAPPRPCGVIAGTAGPSIGNPNSWLTHAMQILRRDEPNDGLLTVEETRCPEMTDFETVPSSHTWIMNHEETKRLVLKFLETGSF